MAGYGVDVLVAGAGPVGLTAALQLARWGVSVRVVDAASGPATTSRALGTQARSLEIYDQLGILGDIAPHGTRVNAFVRHQGDGAARVDFEYGDLATRFPYMFNIDQVITERVLRGHAAAAGAGVEWNTRLESFQHDEDGVTAVLRRGESGAEQETVRARYLWGCDGGHSTVRKTLELPLAGEAAHTWLIADAIVHTDLDRDGVHWLFPAGGALMAFPFPDPHKWRLLDTTGDGDPDDPDQIARQFSTKLSQALGRDTVVENPSWASKFTIQQRAVPAMHVGRCFVSGDAAHVHSPASGQGLNTGIQDAYNLAWKLAMVVHGHAEATLLDTYDAERVPIGQALLASTGKVMDTAMVDTDTAARPGLRPRLHAPAHPQHVGSGDRVSRQPAHAARRRVGARSTTWAATHPDLRRGRPVARLDRAARVAADLGVAPARRHRRRAHPRPGRGHLRERVAPGLAGRGDHQPAAPARGRPRRARP